MSLKSITILFTDKNIFRVSVSIVATAAAVHTIDTTLKRLVRATHIIIILIARTLCLLIYTFVLETTPGGLLFRYKTSTRPAFSIRRHNYRAKI